MAAARTLPMRTLPALLARMHAPACSIWHLARHAQAPAHAHPRLPLQVEDRPVVKERVELIQEHRPVEKEFVVRQGRGPTPQEGSWQVLLGHCAPCLQPEPCPSPPGPAFPL